MNPRKLLKQIVPTAMLEAVSPWGHLAEAIVYNCAYGFPGKSMKVVGVTGTNGKTTTSFLIHRMLQQSGRKTGLMTTVAWAVGEDVRPQKEHMTNVPVKLLMKRLKQMKSEGIEWLVLETTSHALVQHRTWGVPYSIAVLTNITPEHLDYHKTFERYVTAKRKLFKLAEKNGHGLQMGIANADDPNGELFVSEIENSMLYGIENGEVQALNIHMQAGGITYDVSAWGDTYHITSHLPGSFNVYNSLAAVCVGRAIGLTREEVEQGIASLEGVAGRMEAIDAGQPFTVIVDYAHTPDALENVLKALRTSTKGSLAIVFGATGDRDKLKRPVMGEVVANLADKIYVTDDETYTEDACTIRDAVFGGIKAAGGEAKTMVIDDRLEAIRLAFAEAKLGDTVLLAGIGHQDYRAMGSKKQPWDEREVARKLLAALKK